MAASHLLFGIKEETTAPAVSQSKINSRPRDCTRTHPLLTCTPVSIRLISERGAGFISGSNGVPLANSDCHVSLIHLSC